MMDPPAGWYPDPWGTAPWRWWDGMQWTGYWSAGTGPTVPAISPSSPSSPSSPFDLQRAHAKELQMSRWARLSLGAVLVVLTGQWLAALSMGHIWHHIWYVSQSSDGTTTFEVDRLSTTNRYFFLFYGAGAVLSIAFLIWQHSAATVARGLGYPARTSPGLGVASWFIPVVNLWFPFWALSDTLPPEHPLRRRGLWAWLAYVGSGVSAVAVVLVAIASTRAALIPMVVSALLAITAIILGAQLIRAVTDDHQSRLAPR